METTEITRETRRLTRPRDGRYVGGVAAGLGAYFDLNPAIYRIAFAALALAGGTGILLYLAAWAVIPEEGAEDSAAAALLKRHRDRPARAIGLALLAFVAILALSSAHFWPSPGNLWLAVALGIGALVWWQVSDGPTTTAAGEPRAARRGVALFPIVLGGIIAVVGGVAVLDVAGVWEVDWRIVLGALVVATGVAVAAGAAAGRAVGAVVLLALALVVALGLALTIRVPLYAGIGDRTEHPATIAAVDSKYELGIGSYDVDLSDVAFPVGATHVKTTLGIGDLTVHVPYGVKAIVDAHAGGGQVTVFGHTVDGTSVDYSTSAGNAARVVVLDARVGFGHLEVSRG